MAARPRPFLLWILFPLLLLEGLLFFGCVSSKSHPPSPAQTLPPVQPVVVAPPPPAAPEFPVMLGIDVLESEGFRAIAGKRVGLLTHPAGVNRRGVSTIEVLRRALGVKLTALFAVEHGINDEFPASQNFADYVDRRTGLKVFSLYDGRTGRPTREQLRNIDALIIDLQDIGVRSYTFAVRMRYAIEGCFENGVEVIVLDRPNPLGGLKVSGPLLDRELMSGVGGYCIPYVHGLTMGEIARMAVSAPGVLQIDERKRLAGKLTVVPMRGWRRSMRWPETGLMYIPTSPLVQDFAAVVGYAMVGLGCEYSGFTHGIGTNYPFRGVAFKGRTTDVLEKDFATLNVPGVRFRKISASMPNGKPGSGLYVDITDWDAWDPTQLSFEMMRLACRLNGSNPFARLDATQARSFNIHVGSMEWWNALRRDGTRVNVEAFLEKWRAQDRIYQQQTRKYWLYN